MSDQIESYPPEEQRRVMMIRALVGDRWERYDNDAEFHYWVTQTAGELLFTADLI